MRERLWIGVVLLAGCGQPPSRPPDTGSKTAPRTTPAASGSPSTSGSASASVSNAPPSWHSKRKETFVHVGDCSMHCSYESQMGCMDLLSALALPALDATKTRLAVAGFEERGLGTRPNLTVRILSVTKGDVLATMPVFAEADYAPFEGAIEASADTRDPRPMQALQTAMDDRAGVVEKALADGGYVPLPHCTPDPASTNESPYFVAGFDRWTCGDVTLALTGKAASQLHTTLTLTRGPAKKTSSVDAWRLPAVKNPDQPPNGKIDTFLGIAGAYSIPGTPRMLLDIRHACLGGGDWCAPGGNTHHLVVAP